MSHYIHNQTIQGNQRHRSSNIDRIELDNLTRKQIKNEGEKKTFKKSNQVIEFYEDR